MIASGPRIRARLGGWHVVLAEVDAVGVADAGEVGIVVDDEEGAVGVAEPAEGAGRAGDRVLVELLLAQLDDVGAAGQRRPQQQLGILPARAAPRRRSRAARCAAAPAAAGRSPRAVQGSSLDYGLERAPRRGSIGVREPREPQG